MRARKQGTIVNVSSMDGIASLPVNGFYSSSKFALEGLTESLWQEIEPIGLRAVLVEPGSFRTRLADRTKVSGAPIEAYAATSGAVRKGMATMTPERFPGDPLRAAEAVYEARDLRAELRNRCVLLARPPPDLRLTARREGRSDLGRTCCFYSRLPCCPSRPRC